MTVFSESESSSDAVVSIDIAFDHDHIWHPYSRMGSPGPMFPVASAAGVVLTLDNGQQLIDGTASWWSAIHGYNVAELNQAIAKQLPQMAHAMFGGLTHQPAVALAKKLIGLTDESLQKVFFSDSGSVAVEVALKMALQYWQGMEGRGSRRDKFLTVKSGYHGDTFATMAFADPQTGMHGRFGGLFAEHLFAPAPELVSKAWNQDQMKPVSRLLAENHQRLAGVILEPLVQATGGMRIYHPEYLIALRSLCDQYGLLLIFDEIATGFGRTGSLFAYQQAGIVPDILCLGKALTGGYMTLAATLTSQRVADGIAGDGDGTLMHGPTFMANPLACAVANASIELLLSSPWQARVAAIEKQLLTELETCRQLPAVADVRVKGAVGVVELIEPVDMSWIQPRLVELGVWIRPFGKLLYIMPPFIINADQLTRLTQAMASVAAEIADH
ncbi:MAG: adenosylmethionine--8-amino-7-oxononanoate transaminase [Immundisolibacteraceae bacterium]|nr:adenosylmethionine--8-amino-7-oxononanoate transaminase [Immundisolibacteraceae bacterium]